MVAGAPGRARTCVILIEARSGRRSAPSWWCLKLKSFIHRFHRF